MRVPSQVNVTWRPRKRTLVIAAALCALLLLRQWNSSSPTADSVRSPWSHDERRFGDVFRQRHLEKKRGRLRDLKAASVADVPLWSFKYWPCLARERVGRVGDGGKWVCNMEEIEADPACIVYSYGVNDEVSFELELAARTGCRIFAHDPTVTRLPAAAQKVPAISFERLGLAGSDGGGYETLETTMRRRGHTYITLLKVDVEHAEKIAIPAMLNRLNNAGAKGLPFKQLLMEIHHSDRNISATVNLMEELERADLVPYSNEVNHVPCLNKETPKVLEYSFAALRFAPLI